MCDRYILCHLSIFKPCFKDQPKLYSAKSFVNSSLAPTNQFQWKQKGINKSCVLEKFRSVGKINDQTNKKIATCWAVLSQKPVVSVYPQVNLRWPGSIGLATKRPGHLKADHVSQSGLVTRDWPGREGENIKKKK